MLVRVGHRRRRDERGPWDAAAARAGLHPTVLPLLAERRIAALGSDGNNDTAPSAAAGVDFPVHVLAINALGLHLLDYLQFDGAGAGVRGGRALVVPVRHRAAAAADRDRVAGQSDRDPVRSLPGGAAYFSPAWLVLPRLVGAQQDEGVAGLGGWGARGRRRRQGAVGGDQEQDVGVGVGCRWPATWVVMRAPEL